MTNAMRVDFDLTEPGQALPELKLPAIDRKTLALFAGASGDHNPIHIDIDVAHQAGFDDVFAQGMLPMAYLGRLLTSWASPQRLRGWNARFAAVTRLGEVLTCCGTLLEKVERDGERLAKIDIRVINQTGEIKIAGEAWIAL